MITFLKTVLILLLIYFGFKFLSRLLMPYLMRFIAKKAGQKFEQAFGGNPFEERPPSRKEGSISIDKAPKKKSSSHDKVGEYVEYEELD